MGKAKPFDIPKREVLEAFKKDEDKPGSGCADEDSLGRSHFRHRDRFVAGTCQLLGRRLRLLRQSGRQYARCVVISAPTTGGGQ